MSRRTTGSSKPYWSFVLIILSVEWSYCGVPIQRTFLSRLTSPFLTGNLRRSLCSAGGNGANVNTKQIVSVPIILPWGTPTTSTTTEDPESTTESSETTTTSTAHPHYVIFPGQFPGLGLPGGIGGLYTNEQNPVPWEDYFGRSRSGLDKPQHRASFSVKFGDSKKKISKKALRSIPAS